MSLTEPELKEFIIKKELETLICPMPEEQYNGLEDDIVNKGWDDTFPMAAWDVDGELWLVDGHHRYKICHKHKIPFTYTVKKFANINEAKSWMLNKQASTKRNMSKQEQKYAIGMSFKFAKLSRESGDTQVATGKLTAEDIGEKYGGLSHDTVQRYEDEADWINTIAENASTKNTKVSPYDVIAIFEKNKEAKHNKFEEVAKYPPESQKAIISTMKKANNKQTLPVVMNKYKPHREAKTEDKAPENQELAATNETLHSEMETKEFVEGSEPMAAPIINPEVADEAKVPQEVSQPTVGDIIHADPIIQVKLQEKPEVTQDIPADVIIPKKVMMDVVVVDPKYFKLSEDEKSLQFDVFPNGERRSCFIYHTSNGFMFKPPNVENVVYDFNNLFGFKLSPTDKYIVVFELGLSNEEWNDVIQERFPDLVIKEEPEVIEIPASVEAPETSPVEPEVMTEVLEPIPAEETTVEPPIEESPVAEKPKKPAKAKKEKATAEEKPERVYTKDKEIMDQILPTLNKTSFEELIDLTGRRADFNDADKNGRRSIRQQYNTYVRKFGFDIQTIDGKNHYVREQPEPTPEPVVDYVELAMKAIAEGGSTPSEVISKLMEMAFAGDEKEAMEKLESLEKAGKIVKKTVDNDVRYYPVTATV